MPPTASERDLLWIECKAPNPDVPTSWKRVIDEAAERLRIAHPTRRVYLILAIGLKWMPFLWGPVAPTLNPAGSPLQVLKDNQRDVRAVDPGMHMIALANLPGQRHVQRQQNGALIVDTRSAYSLNYRALDGNKNPANLHGILLLENYFALIQATEYQGCNPPGF